MPARDGELRLGRNRGWATDATAATVGLGRILAVRGFRGSPFLFIVALLMVSTIHYPSFKHIDWNTRIRVQGLVLCLLAIVLIYQFHYFAIAGIFVSYLLYGIVRHFFRRRAQESVPESLD